MINVIVIDDEPLARSIVLEYLSKHSNINVVQECGDGYEALKACMQHKPDLIFLDIQMPKISGFEMLELLDPSPSVIFTTAFDDYAIKAFEAHAIDYLLKPFSKERFDKAISKWMEQKKNASSVSVQSLLENSLRPTEEQNRVVVKEGSSIKIVPVQDIIYLEAYDDYVKVYTSENMYLKKKTMGTYEQVLDPNLFVRIHRSFIVQLSQITRIEQADKDSHKALLKNGTFIPISRTGYIKLKKLLGE